MSDALFSLRGLVKHFPVRSGVLRRVTSHVRAIDGIDLDVERGETLGLVGESGSGKSTTARVALRLLEPTAGSITFDGTDLTTLNRNALRAMRRRIQLIFQDPYASLSPRLTVARIVGEPLMAHDRMSAGDRDARVAEVLDQVGLDSSMLDRYPYEFSGGQRQRVAIARALALEPDLVVCDEPVSALDVSIQSQVVNLLADLQERLGLAYLFISHDLDVVDFISDRIGVMYLGEIVESGPAEMVFNRAAHPYTTALLAAAPALGTAAPDRSTRLRGEIPSPDNPPSGCPFHTRCPRAESICSTQEPPSRRDGEHVAVCHFADLGVAVSSPTDHSTREP